MAIPNGVVLIWTGTHATIPAGWERETSLDDKFPKGHGVENPNTTGGSNTHTHVATTHSHTMVAHSHYITVNFDTESVGASDPNGNATSGHKHNSTIAGISGGTSSSNVVTWSSVNSEPPYYKVIFIKPSSTVGIVQAGICAHYYGTTTPLGWFLCDGNNGTIDLRGKYLKGSSALSNAGMGNGANSHSHVVTHGHAGTVHSHSGTSVNAHDDHGSRQSIAGDNIAANFNHTHTFYLGNSTDTIADYTKTDAGSSDTIDLAYKKLGTIQCYTPIMSKGLIGLWLGSVATIPPNWKVCDGNNETIDLQDKFVKVATTLSENGDTGGSNTHSHTGISHTHTGSSHNNHGFSTSGPSATAQKNGGGGNGWSNNSHTHSQFSQGATTASYNNTSLDGPSTDHQPAYRTVAYIQQVFSRNGGGFPIALL